LAQESQRSLIDNPEMSFVNFLVVNPNLPPLDRAPCRDAIFYALDKVDLQNVRGGSATAAIAHSLSPPTILGHDILTILIQVAAMKLEIFEKLERAWRNVATQMASK
jgi:hypothetical protein